MPTTSFIGRVAATLLLAILSSGGAAVSALKCEKMNLLMYATAAVVTYNTEDGVTSPGDTTVFTGNVTDTDGNDMGNMLGGCIVGADGILQDCHNNWNLTDGTFYVRYVQTPPTNYAGILGGTGGYESASGQFASTMPEKDGDPFTIEVDLCLPDDTSAMECKDMKLIMDATGYTTTYNTKDDVSSPGDTTEFTGNVTDTDGNDMGTMEGACITGADSITQDCHENWNLTDGTFYTQFTQTPPVNVAGIVGGIDGYKSASGELIATLPEKDGDPFTIEVKLCLPVSAMVECKERKLLAYATGMVNTYNTKDDVASPGDTSTWTTNVTDTDGNGMGTMDGACIIGADSTLQDCHENWNLTDGTFYTRFTQTPPENFAGIVGGMDGYKSASGQLDATFPENDGDPFSVNVNLCLPVDSSTDSDADTDPPAPEPTESSDTDPPAPKPDDHEDDHDGDDHEDDHDGDCHCDGDVAHCKDEADEAAYASECAPEEESTGSSATTVSSVIALAIAVSAGLFLVGHN